MSDHTSLLAVAIVAIILGFVLCTRSSHAHRS